MNFAVARHLNAAQTSPVREQAHAAPISSHVSENRPVPFKEAAGLHESQSRPMVLDFSGELQKDGLIA